MQKSLVGHKVSFCISDCSRLFVGKQCTCWGLCAYMMDIADYNREMIKVTWSTWSNNRCVSSHVMNRFRHMSIQNADLRLQKCNTVIYSVGAWLIGHIVIFRYPCIKDFNSFLHSEDGKLKKMFKTLLAF